MLGREDAPFGQSLMFGNRSIQRQFEDSELMVAPGIHLGGPKLVPVDWVDTFRSLQYGGKMLLFANP